MRSFRSDTSQEEGGGGGGGARPKKNAPGSVGPGAARRRTEGCEAGRAPTTPRSKPPTWSRARDRFRVSLESVPNLRSRRASQVPLWAARRPRNLDEHSGFSRRKGRTPNISEDISERSRSRRQGEGRRPANRRVQVCNCLCRRWRCWLSREVERGRGRGFGRGGGSIARRPPTTRGRRVPPAPRRLKVPPPVTWVTQHTACRSGTTWRASLLSLA